MQHYVLNHDEHRYESVPEGYVPCRVEQKSDGTMVVSFPTDPPRTLVLPEADRDGFMKESGVSNPHLIRACHRAWLDVAEEDATLNDPRYRIGVMRTDVSLAGTSLRLGRFDRVALIHATNLPEGDGVRYYARPIDCRWPDGVRRDPDISIPIEESDVELDPETPKREED